MTFEFKYEIDKVNKILICEAYGTISDIKDAEHVTKNMVKLAGKNQVSNIVFDVTKLIITCSSVDISNMLIDVKGSELLGHIKLARIVCSQQNNHYLIGELAQKLDLSIRNFETKSEAMLWLLFDKLPE